MNARLAVLVDYVESVSAWNPLTGGGASFSYIDLSSVDQTAKVITGATTVLCSGAPSRARQLIKRDDVLVSTVRPNLNGVAAVTAEYDGATASTGFCVLRPRPSKLSSRYLLHWVRSPQFVDSMVRQATGASYPAVTDRVVKSSFIPLPSLNEQRRIAAILDKADALRRKHQETISLLGSLARSMFLEMFGDPLTNSKGWKERSLADFESFLTSGSRGWAKHYSPSGRVFIRIQNLQQGELSTSDVQYVEVPDSAEARRTTVRSGDVLISITADLGRTAVVPVALDGQAHINQHIALVRTKGINPTYLAMYLASPAGQLQFRALNRQGVKAGLNFDNIRSLRILEPPIELQNEYVSTLTKIRNLSERSKHSGLKLCSLFSSLQSRAFSGQL